MGEHARTGGDPARIVVEHLAALARREGISRVYVPAADVAEAAPGPRIPARAGKGGGPIQYCHARDGTSIAYISDASGEDEIWVTDQAGKGKARKISTGAR